MLKVGDKAPEFNLESSDGGNVSLDQLQGKKIVIYFYPKDDTPGCTIEACEFRDSNKEIINAGAVVFGVSKDNITSHQKFISKFDLNFPLLSDEDGEMCVSYGAWGEKTSFGKTSLGILRITFLIDEFGVIAKIWKNVKPQGHSKEVLEAIMAS